MPAREICPPCGTHLSSSAWVCFLGPSTCLLLFFLCQSPLLTSSSFQRLLASPAASSPHPPALYIALLRKDIWSRTRNSPATFRLCPSPSILISAPWDAAVLQRFADSRWSRREKPHWLMPLQALRLQELQQGHSLWGAPPPTYPLSSPGAKGQGGCPEYSVQQRKREKGAGGGGGGKCCEPNSFPLN